MVVPVHGMFYEHLLSVKVLKRVKGVPFFFCLGRYKSTLDKTQRGWWNAWINERRMVRGRAEKKTIKTKHGRGAIKDRKKNGDILAVCGKAKSIISAFVFIWKGLPQQWIWQILKLDAISDATPKVFVSPPGTEPDLSLSWMCEPLSGEIIKHCKLCSTLRLPMH